MTDQAPAPAQQQPPAADPPAGEPLTLAALDDKIDALASALQGFIARGGGGQGAGPATQPDQPAVVEQQVRAELERLTAERERRETEAGQAAAIKTQGEQLEQLRKDLAESPPAEPVRRVTRFLWGDPGKTAGRSRAGAR